MAIGLAIVYRLNKVVNFAQGDLGAAPAVLAFGLVALSGVDYFLGLLTGLVAVLVLTVAVEVLVVRRFVRGTAARAHGRHHRPLPASRRRSARHPAHLGRDADRHGLDQPALARRAHRRSGDPRPERSGRGWWSRSSASPPSPSGSRGPTSGIAVRATGDRRDRAAMLGIPVNRLQTMTWTVAGTLSFLSVFFKAAIVGLPLDPTFSLTALGHRAGGIGPRWIQRPASQSPPPRSPSASSKKGWPGTRPPIRCSSWRSSPQWCSARCACDS